MKPWIDRARETLTQIIQLSGNEGIASLLSDDDYFSKPLEEIYRSNLNALNLIARLKQGIKDSKEKTSNLTNSSYFNLIYLNSRVPSEKATLNLVNETLKTCDELDKEGKKISP